MPLDVSRVVSLTYFLWALCIVGHGRSMPRPPGPNMCAVQQVYGTGEKFFTHCVAKHLRMICERPTFMSWDCCSGYEREPGRHGCTKEKPLEDLVRTAQGLGLSQLLQHVQHSNLTHELSTRGAFTVFAPSDQAFNETSPWLRNQLQSTDGSQSLLRYHISPGRLPLSTFKARNQQFTTLYQDQKIRVNKYAYGVATVNCARIVRPDEKATNGVIHVIDKVVKPLQEEGDLASKIFADDKLSQFQLALMVADMVGQLQQQRRGQGFTVLAPTDEAFSKLSAPLLETILNDPATAEKVIRHHVVKGVYCGDAIVLSVGLKTLAGSRLLFRCTKEGLTVNGASVVESDSVASNGVLHAIDTVLLPDSVREPTDLMEELQVRTFLEMTASAGLTHRLNNVSDVTIFTPTDLAFKRMPTRQRAALENNPGAVEKLLDYHVVQGQLTDDDIIGSMDLKPINSGVRPSISANIKVNVFREGVAVNNARTVGALRQCGKAAVQKIDKVLTPPEFSLMTLIDMDRGLSVFKEMVERAEMAETLWRDGRYTVLAPTDRAFSYLDQTRLKRLMDDPQRLSKFVNRHIINRMVPQCEIPSTGTYSIPSRQGDLTVFNYDTSGYLLVNDLIKVRDVDKLALNGILYTLDDVLRCSCERGLAGTYRYRVRRRNRRHYHKLRY